METVKIPTPAECLKVTDADELTTVDDVSRTIAGELKKQFVSQSAVVTVKVPEVNDRVAEAVRVKCSLAGWTTTHKRSTLSSDLTSSGGAVTIFTLKKPAEPVYDNSYGR